MRSKEGKQETDAEGQNKDKQETDAQSRNEDIIEE